MVNSFVTHAGGIRVRGNVNYARACFDQGMIFRMIREDLKNGRALRDESQRRPSWS